MSTWTDVIHPFSSSAEARRACDTAGRLPNKWYITMQAPLLVDFRDNSNEAEIKMTLQFASTAKAQVCKAPCRGSVLPPQ